MLRTTGDYIAFFALIICGLIYVGKIQCPLHYTTCRGKKYDDMDITKVFAEKGIPLPSYLVNEKENEKENEQYPQDAEPDEFRYLDPNWLIHMSEGLTKGALKHPGESWRDIPAKEHAWRAIRHLIKFIAGDTDDDHLGNASMRVMMAWSMAKEEKE